MDHVIAEAAIELEWLNSERDDVPSETDLLNDALGSIGASRITAIDDGSTNANHCQTFYPALRDAWLTFCHWKFNKARIELAADATPPLFEFAFSYTLPSDNLKLIEYNGVNTDTSSLVLFEFSTVFRFKIEGNKLLTNDGAVKIVYLKRVTDPNLWTPLFYQGLSALLAGKLAMAIPKDARMSLAKFNEGQAIMLLAAAVDGQQGSVEPFRADDLMWGR